MAVEVTPGVEGAQVIITTETGKDTVIVGDGRGPRGLPGDDGTDGADGTDGVDGHDGLSAYEVAVMDGFMGTEQEWLDSLVGPQGPPGAPGSAPQAFTFEQASPSSVWTIHHNLTFKPAGLQVFDSGGTEWEGIPHHIDNNTLTLTWSAPFAGVAYLS